MGLSVIVERKERLTGNRRQVVEIVNGVEAGQSVAQIAQELGVHASRVERRLADVRKAAAVSVEAEQLNAFLFTFGTI
jgi:predicted ArsR family transcriptional regulator